MRLTSVVLAIGLLNSPNSLTAQSLQVEIDSISVIQFHADIDDFLKKSEELKNRAAKYLSLKKEDYIKVILGTKKDFPSTREGKQLLLDFYVETGNVLKLLYNLEHLEMKEEKKRSEYRNLLAEYLKVTSSILIKVGAAYEIASILENRINK